MKYIVNAAQMKSYDRYAIERTGILSLVLMERAAAATAEEIMKRFPKTVREGSGKERKREVLVAGGCGNNGGDGFAVGRILEEHGYGVTCVLIGEREKCSRETAAQIEILERIGIRVKAGLPGQAEETGRGREGDGREQGCGGRGVREEDGFSRSGGWDVIVDALFGIGLSREITGIYKDAVQYINRSGAYVVSADIPSGIHADTGAVMGTAVRADLTVTYGYEKAGLVFYPGADYAGELLCRKIGISYREGMERPTAFAYEREDLARLPVRENDGNKGSFGKVFIIAGSREMYGACRLSVLGAYRSGAGLVRVLTSGANRELLLSAVPEVIADTYEEEFPEEALAGGLAWADCVVIGPGIGKGPLARRMTEYVWENCRTSLIVDADGLNILAESGPAWRSAAKEVYFTPHMGELSRLTKKSIKCCKEERIATVKEFAAAWGVVVVSKDARTVTVSPDGRVCINTSGDNGMATGGSGDVLAGILAGLVAQGMKGLEAAGMAAYVHGLAGNAASGRRSVYSVMAGDLLEELPALFLSALKLQSPFGLYEKKDIGVQDWAGRDGFAAEGGNGR